MKNFLQICQIFILTFFLTLGSLGLFDFGNYRDGQNYGFYGFNICVYFGVLILSLSKILNEINSVSFLFVIIMILILGVFFGIWILISGHESSAYY